MILQCFKRQFSLTLPLLSVLNVAVVGAQATPAAAPHKPGNSLLAGRALQSIDALVRPGSEMVFDAEMRRVGCAPLSAYAPNMSGRSLSDVSDAVRAQILGVIPRALGGKVIDNQVLQRSDQYVFRQVSVLSRLGGIPTFAYAMQPASSSDSRPTVILLHGSGTLPHQAFGLRLDKEGGAVTNSDSTPFIGIGLNLVHAGFNVVAPLISRLPSQREGEIPWLSVSTWGEILREKMGVGGTETFLVAEIESFIDYAISQSTPGSQVYLVGWGEGAYLASLVAGYDPRVRGLVRLESPFDRKVYRNGNGQHRDAGFAHVECVLGDPAQAAMLRGKPLMYAAARNDANEVLRAKYHSSAVVDSVRAI